MKVAEIVLMVFVGIGVVTLLWVGSKPKPVPVTIPEMGVCKIIIPHGHIEEGWQYWDPADNGTVSNLMRDGKAEIMELPRQIECTVHSVNKTPVTTPGALSMWRRR